MLLELGKAFAAPGLPEPVRIGDLLAQEPWSELYTAEYAGESCTVRWLLPAAAEGIEDQRRALLKDIPAARQAVEGPFLWPLTLLENRRDHRFFGYLRQWPEPRFRPLGALLRGVEGPPDDAALLTASLGLSTALDRLHRAGYCLPTLHLGSIRLDPTTGDVLLDHLEGLRREGERRTLLVLPFAAPEVLRGQAGCHAAADLHALGVLLFYLWMRGHPLEGGLERELEILDEPARDRLYAERPLFVFDPENPDNRPDADVDGHILTNWEALPGPLQERFVRCFTTGLEDPAARPGAGEWAEAFAACEEGSPE